MIIAGVVVLLLVLTLVFSLTMCRKDTVAANSLGYTSEYGGLQNGKYFAWFDKGSCEIQFAYGDGVFQVTINKNGTQSIRSGNTIAEAKKFLKDNT